MQHAKHQGVRVTEPHAVQRARPALAVVGEPIAHHSWNLAWAGVLNGLEQAGVVLLIGLPGTGKSLMLETLEGALRRAGHDARLLRRGGASMDTAPSMLLVDDAERLPGPVLQTIAQWKHVCVLAGTPALLAAFPSLNGLAVVSLGQIRHGDAAGFIAMHLQRGGHPPTLLHPAAMDALVQHGGATPRTLLALTDLAVFLARLEDAPQVSAAHVLEALQVQDGTRLDGDDEPLADAPGEPPAPLPATPARPASQRSFPRWAYAGAALPVAGMLVALALRGPPAAPRSPAVAEAARPASQPSVAPTPAAPAAAQPGALPDSPSPALLDSQAQPSPIAETDPLAALPDFVPVRVTVAYRRGDERAERRSADVARRLRAAGLEPETQAEGAGPAEPAVSYYFAEDAGIAGDVARHAGLGPAKLVPPRGALPRPGTVRVAVPGPDSPKQRRAGLPSSTAGDA